MQSRYLVALGGREVVVEQVVARRPCRRADAGGEVGVGLGKRVAPDVVADGRVHVAFGGREDFGVAFHLVGEGALGDGEGDVVLRAAGFGGRRRRIAGEDAEVGEIVAPLGCGGAVEFGAEGVEFGGGEVDAGMDVG